MKTIAILFTLFYFLNALAAAPYGIKGQQQTSTLYSNVHQFPNNQVTNMGGIDAVVETGNSNILSNPSFEHLTANTGWVDNGTATGIGTAVAVISGKKAYGFLPTAQTINLTQSSTLYQAQFADGVQGLAMVRIKSDVALKVCSIQAGTVSTTNCVNTNTDSKWGLYKVPFILGATSNGISISSTGVSVTGSTVIVDDAFVGAQDVTQNITACQTADCTTEFSAFVATAGTVSNENIDSINGNCVLTNGTTTTCTFNAGLYTVAPNCAVSGNGGGEKFIVSVSSASVAIGYANSAGSGGAKTDVTIICQKQGSDYVAAISRSNGNTYSSNNSDTDWASCGLTGAAFTGFGSAVPTPSLQCKRQGSDLLIKGNFTSGTTPTAVEARMALPVWNGVQLTSAGSSVIPILQNAGKGNVNNAALTFFSGITVLIEPSVSYVTFGLESSSASGATKQTGSSTWSSGLPTTISARIPINGWNNSNIIIGSFNGLQTCTDTLACTDTFSAKITGGGIVSGENVDWISGNASLTDTSLYAISFNSGIFTTAPNCTLTEIDAVTTLTTSVKNSTEPTTSGASVRTGFNTTASSFTKAVVPFHIICQKQGADYIGKTAMAVASDQNVRSIGSTNVDIQSVIFGTGANCASVCSTGTCSLCNQSGSKITSVTWNATGSYNVNGLDGTKYLCTGGGEGTSYVNAYTRKDLSTSSLVRVQTGIGVTLTNSAATIICMGIP